MFSPATRCLRSVVAEAPGGRLLRQVAAGPPRAALVAGAAAGVEGAGSHWASGIDLLGHIGYIYIYDIYIYHMKYALYIYDISMIYPNDAIYNGI